MRLAKLSVGLFTGLLASGCSNMSSSTGTSGDSTVHGRHGEKLTVVKPHDQDIERGGTETVTILLRRHNISDSVRVSFTGLPSGIEAVDTPRSVNGEETKIVLRASDAADLVSNQQVEVLADGPDGIRAIETFRLTVKERKS
jgi:hypothetical protein